MRAITKKRKSNSKKIIKQIPIQQDPFGQIKMVLLVFALLLVLSFNFFIKVDVRAQDSDQAISVETLLREHNEYRKENGVSELRLNNLLISSSRSKGEIMIDAQCWSHYCPAGKSPWDFFDDVNYNYIYAGENLAEGYYNIDSLMQAWINSRTHRENIIKPEFSEVGFSILYGDYLNNPNNILVVVHFGSTLDSAEILSQQNPVLEITSPLNDTTTSQSNIEILGNINGLDNARVFNNNVVQGNAQISGGSFSFRVINLQEGKNTIWVEGNNEFTTINSNQLNVTYTKPVENINSQFIFVNDTQGNLTITQDNKNLINLIFIGFLALIFLIDVVVISRTRAISSKKSFSHYHLSLVLLLGIVVLIGGFAGQIQNGLSV